MSEQFRRWKVEIFVSQNWVDDGFELTEELVQEAITSLCLPYSVEGEVRARMRHHGEPVREQSIPAECECSQCVDKPGKTLCEIFSEEKQLCADKQTDKL